MHFLGTAHTLANFEQAFYRSTIADNSSFEQWSDEGGLDAAQRANAIWKQRLAEYEAPPIDAAVDEELRAFVDPPQGRAARRVRLSRPVLACAGMELEQAMEFVRGGREGVLTTIRRDGRPQLSNIVYAVDAGGTIRISVTAGRAKTKNLARDPRASLYVRRESFWAYAVVDGPAELTPVADRPARRDRRRAGRALPLALGRARRLGRLPPGDGRRRPPRDPHHARRARTGCCRAERCRDAELDDGVSPSAGRPAPSPRG